jgi:hypothetical protein
VWTGGSVDNQHRAINLGQCLDRSRVGAVDRRPVLKDDRSREVRVSWRLHCRCRVRIEFGGLGILVWFSQEIVLVSCLSLAERKKKRWEGRERGEA